MLCALKAMLETIDNILSEASSFLWGYVLIFALLGTHWEE